MRPIQSWTPSPTNTQNAAEILTAHKQEILNRWESRAQKELPSAAGKESSVFADWLPLFINEVIRYFEVSSSKESSSKQSILRELAEFHAAQRASMPGYTLEEVNSEYTILRQVIFEVMDEFGLTQARERNLILDCIVEGRTTAAKEYMRLAKTQIEWSNEELTLAVESANMGTFYSDVHTGTIVCSDIMIRLHGISFTEFKGKIDDLLARVPSEDRILLHDKIDEAIAQKKDYYIEYRILQPDGSTRWILSKGRPYYDQEGKPIRVRGTAYDITERKEFEDSIRDERRWYEMVLDSVPTPIILLDSETHGVVFKNEAVKSLRFPIPTLIPESGPLEIQIFDDDEKELSLEQFPRYRVLRGEEVHGMEITSKSPQNTTQFVVDGKPFKACFGHPPGGILSFRDITESKQTRNALKESERKLRLINDSIPQIIWTASADASIDEYNQNWQRYIGTPTPAGRNWQNVLHPDDLDKTLNAWKEAQQTGHYQVEHRLKCSDGNFRWFLSRAIPSRDSHGKITQWFGTSTDIDEQKKIQETLEQERKTIDQFVNALSHDLRNPLSAARISAQMIARRPNLTDHIPGLASRILDSLSRADKMIEDLLDTSRIRAGKGIPIEIIQCDLSEVANKVCDELATIHGDRFKRSFNSPLIGYWSCKDLHRLLENLITNGLKYGYPHTPVTLRIEEDSDHIDIEVHNSGEPIPKEDLKHLFDPYMRTHSAKAGDKKGWGLGLTLVRGVAVAHGGSVEVRSDSHQGTTFHVRLLRDARKKPTATAA